MTEWDADRDRAVDPAAVRNSDAELERLRADLEWLRGEYGPPQPRDPQEGQLALPIDGEGRDWKNSGLPHRDHELPDDDGEPEGANE